MIVIDTKNPTPIYLQIMDRIREGVREGTIGPRAALPSVRQMASDLGVNPNTVAKAYMLLERDGIVRSVRRRGSFVADSAPERVKESMETKLVETLDRIMEETENLGIDRETFLSALRRRLGLRSSPSNDESGGEGQ
jgi:GntR family transcriptional regulator